MKAVRIEGKGGAEVLRLAEVADPPVGPDEVRVRVRATALNRADLLQARGGYPAPPEAPADIPGLELAGEVEAVGARAQRFRPGERVMGLIAGGAFAELAVVHERALLPIPSRLSFAEAAAVPEAFFTAFDALVLQGGLRFGEAVLIHAVGSGVGTAACQLAHALGARTLGTARSKEKLERCRSLGLDHGLWLESTPPLFAAQVKALTGGLGVDLVLDLVGGPYLSQTVEACAPRARVLAVGLLGGRDASVDLLALLTRRLTLIGTVLRGRPLEEKLSLARAFERQVLPLLAEGRLAPVIDRVLPLTRVAEGAALLESNQTFGKIVFTLAPEPP